MGDVTPVVSDQYKQAVRLYRAGMLDRAEEVCRAIVGIRGDHFESWQLLANAQFRLGRLDQALASYERALAVRPDDAGTLYNRGATLQGLSRFEDALASYDRALAVKPDLAAALVNRGIALRKLGRFEEALASCDRAAAVNPDHPGLALSRGHVLRDLRRYDEALRSYDQALALEPADAGLLRGRGNVLGDLRRHEEALACYQQALAIDPRDADAHSDRGLALWRLKRFEDALASYDRALAIAPDHAEACNNRGVCLHDIRRLEDALASYDRALALKPDYVEALNNRGLVLRDLMRHREALECYDKALALNPDYAAALNNRGPALWDLGRFEDALESYRMALALRPDHAGMLYNRGMMLHDLRRYESAIADFELVLRIDPQFKYARGQLLFTRMHCCDWRTFADELRELTADVQAGTCASNPFALLSLSASAGDQLACARTWVRDKCPAAPTPIWKGNKYSHDRIRVAYLSADLRDHPMALLMAGVFERHDPAQFDTVALSFGPERESEMRTRLKAAFGRFIDVGHDSDRDVAGRLRELEIDIAVDLMGFTRDARTAIFALRPAPVQVNYLGLNATMGAGYIDYIIADRFVIPPQSQGFYAEKVVWLPDTFQANDSTRRIDPRPQDRVQAGLPEQGFVFCAFNNNCKITPDLFSVWMRLLCAVEGSVLWLLWPNAAAERNLRHEAEARGVAADRLIFAPRIANAEYLARFRLADLFLDTLPFNACTTASDALWAGLPLVTVSGEAFAARMAGSLLHAVGLPELVTHSLADYEAVALGLARDPQALAAVKSRLAHNRTTRPLFDTDRFRRHLEAAYTTMWQRHQRGEPPASFAVEPQP